MNRHPLALGVGMALNGMRVPLPHEKAAWDRIQQVNRADFACRWWAGLR